VVDGDVDEHQLGAAEGERAAPADVDEVHGRRADEPGHEQVHGLVVVRAAGRAVSRGAADEESSQPYFTGSDRWVQSRLPNTPYRYT
jgi:hypothetical protein